MLCRKVESGEDDFRRAIRHPISIGIRDENQVGGRTQPNPSHANGNTREVGTVVQEDLFCFKGAITVFVFENGDPILPFGGVSKPHRIGKTFRHPKPTLGIGGEGNRLQYFRFRSD